MIVSLSMSVSMLLAGALTDALDPRSALAICGGLTLVYGIAWHAGTRRLLRPKPGALRSPDSVAISPQ
jgi:hypothetical protein